MKGNKIIAGIMAVCVMGFGVPYVNVVAENNSAITASAVDYTEGTYGLLTYKNYGDYVEISGCDESATEVVIPSEIEGVPVTSIGNRAFKDCSSLTLVEIPDSVTSIGDMAFCLCIILESVEIPDVVTSIGYKAFDGTLWLDEKRKENPLVVVNNILIDGKTCSGEVVIPDIVTSIGNYAFDNCGSLTSIEIPDSVTIIEGCAFLSCSSLTSVIIPDSVTSIEHGTFYGCSKLTSIEIPNSVTSIGYSAFSNCSNLTLIKIPDSVISIERQAFYGCSSLTSIEIPDDVTSIGMIAFSDCSSLTEITILNPECELYDASGTISDTTTIYGYENSTAQEYAEKYNINFVSLGKASDKETSTGDMNGDNSVSVADAVLLQKCILGSETLTEEQLKSADMNIDGVVDSFDLVLLRREIIENNK